MYSDQLIYVFAYLLIIFNIFPIIDSLKNKDKPCHQFSTCKCIFPTGRGINLFTIDQQLSVQNLNNQTILIHLCEDVSFGKIENGTFNQCFQNVSACFVDPKSNNSLSLGKAKDMTFISTSQFEPIRLEFNNGNNKTVIDLICDEEKVDSMLSLTSIENSLYNLQLRSKHACVHLFSSEEGPSGGLSTGSVLVIMLLIFSLVYFGGGMLTLRLLRGAEGREMIPNIDFWMDLPYLVRDGVLFTLNGFQPPASYDRI